MSTDQSLNQLRRRAYLAYHNDGILDLIIGLSVIGFGLMLVNGSLMVFSWIPILFYVPLKNLITVPRFGYVQFDSDVQIKTRWAMTLATGVLTLSVFVGLYFALAFDAMPADLQSWFGKHFLLILGGFGAMILIGAGRLTSLTRLYVYAVLMLAIIYLGIWLAIPEPTYIVVLGLVFVVPGLWMLLRFLRKYPRVEPSDAER
jgi:hypothetical protein